MQAPRAMKVVVALSIPTMHILDIEINWKYITGALSEMLSYTRRSLFLFVFFVSSQARSVKRSGHESSRRYSLYFLDLVDPGRGN